MNSSSDEKTLEALPDPDHPVGPIRHLTEKDLSQEDRSRLFASLNRGKRWFDGPAYPPLRPRLKPSPTSRIRRDRLDPQKPS